MSVQNTIRQLIAGFFCCLFLLALTPEKLLHDYFANHKDTIVHCSSKDTHYHQGGYNCHCDKIVAQAPFIKADDLSADFIIATTSSFFLTYLTAPLRKRYLLTHLRGPPASRYFSC